MQSKINKKKESLKPNSVWMFTKQDTNFDEAFKSTLLFDEMPNKQNANLEKYFEENHARYDISTHRHRVLVIAQLYGLLTKTPFYSRGGRYLDEKPTDVFKELKKYPIGSVEYNTIKTEQILKLKIKAIIDTAGNNEDYQVLPVIYIYEVLKRLKNDHGINQIKIDVLYSYVLTSSSHDEIEDIVSFIASGATPSSYVSQYKDLSRVLTLINNNINLFKIESDNISLNDKYVSYFENNFLSVIDLNDILINIKDSISYSELLYYHHDFGINLIDIFDENVELVKKPEKIKITTYADDEDEDEDNYQTKINEIREETFNEKISKDAHKNEPQVSEGTGSKRKYKVNPTFGKIAIKKSEYTCEFNPSHTTFISNRTGKAFMEGHHLIPVSLQEEFWEKYSINIDCPENIVSLCPNCHRAIHYGDNAARKEVVEKLYDIKINNLKKVGIDISKETLFKIYNVT